MTDKSKIVFVGVFLFILISFSAFYASSLDLYQRPDRFVPLRHFAIPGTVQPVKDVFVWRIDSRPVTLTLERSSLVQLLNDGKFNGLRIYTGTNGREVKSSVFAKLRVKEAIWQCESSREALFRDNSWSDVFFHCSRNSPNGQANPGSMVSEAAADVEVILTIPQKFDFAIYAATHSANLVPEPAIELVASRYVDDRPPQVSSRLSLRRLFPWLSPHLELLLGFVFLMFLGLSTVLLVDSYRCIRSKSVQPTRMTGLAFALWVILSASYALVTPAFQNPAEPQHALGVAASSLERPQADELRKLFLEAALQTKFLEVKQLISNPILPDYPAQQGFGDSDFEVNAKERSSLYALFARYTLPVYFWCVRSMDLDAVAALSLLRLTLSLLPYLLLSASFCLLLFKRQTIACIFLLLCLSLPVSTSLFTSVSNYGWSIAVGAACATFVFVSGIGRERWLYSLIAGLLTPVLSDSSTPVTMFVYIAPFIALGRLLFTFAVEKIQFSHLWHESKFKFFAALFPYPIGFLFGSLLFAERWNSQVVAALLGASQQVLSRYGLSELTFFRDAFNLILTVPALWVFCVWIVVGLPAAFTVSSLQWNGKAKAFGVRWALTLGVIASLCVICSLMSVKYAEPTFAPSIYGLQAQKPDFLAFLKTCLHAFFSQFVHVPQDYFLWQTNFLAYGWLETVAPQPYYFLLKVLFLLSLIGCVVAVVWRTMGALFLVVTPLLLMCLTWVVLLYGAWGQSHTLLGRYLLPLFGFFLLPFVGALELFFGREYRKLFLMPVIFIICLFMVSSLSGFLYFIPQRFLVGGFG